MTLLLVILLVVYFAAVSAPFSPRLVGLLLARNGLRELPLLGTSTVVRSAKPKSRTNAAAKWFRRDRRAIVRHQDAHIQRGRS
jgi:hypothetical protein